MEEARTTEKPYTFRNLEAKDVFIVSKIVSQIGLNEFKDAFNPEAIRKMVTDTKDDKQVAAVGMTIFMDMAQVLLANLPKCEKDIYAFLSSLSGMDKKEIECLPMNTFIEMIIDVVKKEEFTDFFRLVSKLFK